MKIAHRLGDMKYLRMVGVIGIIMLATTYFLPFANLLDGRMHLSKIGFLINSLIDDALALNWVFTLNTPHGNWYNGIPWLLVAPGPIEEILALFNIIAICVNRMPPRWIGILGILLLMASFNNIYSNYGLIMLRLSGAILWGITCFAIHLSIAIWPRRIPDHGYAS